MAKKTTQDISMLDEAEEERMLQQQLQTGFDSEDDTEQPKKKTPKKGKKSKAHAPLQAGLGSEDDTEDPKKGKKRKLKGPSEADVGSEQNMEEPKEEPEKGKKSIAQAPLPTPESEENSGVPARIRAERKASNQVQLLVQWKNYPDEKDWTWELESELKESVPQMVKAWKVKKSKGEKEFEGVIEHTVEKILSKKTYKGKPHYLVKWEGYDKVEDRTWEPSERLTIDVPEIVEDYESKGKGTGKSKK